MASSSCLHCSNVNLSRSAMELPWPGMWTNGRMTDYIFIPRRMLSFWVWYYDRSDQVTTEVTAEVTK